MCSRSHVRHIVLAQTVPGAHTHHRNEDKGLSLHASCIPGLRFLPRTAERVGSEVVESSDGELSHGKRQHRVRIRCSEHIHTLLKSQAGSSIHTPARLPHYSQRLRRPWSVPGAAEMRTRPLTGRWRRAAAHHITHAHAVDGTTVHCGRHYRVGMWVQPLPRPLLTAVVTRRVTLGISAHAHGRRGHAADGGD